MEKWQEFEIKCCEYLNKTYGNPNVVFESKGASDSYAPDIVVSKGGEPTFNIEVKSAAAQSGQFVVLQENGKFVFSDKNKSDALEAQPFIDHMNENFDKYKDVGTTAIKVDMPASEYLSWMVNHYKSKNEKFVITKGNKGYTIFPIEKYGEYFDTVCSFRIKKSGSADVPKNQENDIKQYFTIRDNNSTTCFDGKKLYVTTAKSYVVKETFFIGENGYTISDAIKGKLYIRKLSKTRNANIIFSIKLKKEQVKADLEKFEDSLR